MTPEWLTEVLYTDRPGVAVTSFSLSENDDGTSNRRRIFLEYNEQGRALGLPPSIFAKASQHLIHRISYALNQSINREGDFYDFVRPRLDVEVIEALFSNYDMESGNSINLFEDVQGQVTFMSEDTDISFSRAQDMTRLLANMHATFSDPDAFKILEGRFVRWPDMWDMLRASEFETYCDKGFLAAQDLIPSRLFKRAAEVWPRTLDSVEMHHQLPATFCHGDTQLGNWYITSDDRVGLTDWGGTNLGHWSRDLAYGFGTWLTPENRRAWERDLLIGYLDRLRERGVASVPSLDDAFLWYRQQMLSALAYWTVQVTPSPNIPESTSANHRIACFLGRLATAVDDLESLDSFIPEVADGGQGRVSSSAPDVGDLRHARSAS
nr:aminoglycoside phosphotransferase family protein [Sphingobium sp. 15-1]